MGREKRVGMPSDPLIAVHLGQKVLPALEEIGRFDRLGTIGGGLHDRSQNRLGIGQKYLAFRGQTDISVIAIKQCSTELFLKVAHLLADGRLGYVQ